MKSFDEYLISSWKAFDVFGSDYYFYGVTLVKDAFPADVYDEIMEDTNLQDDPSDINMYISFDDTGSYVQIYNKDYYWDFGYKIVIDSLSSKGKCENND